MWREPSTPLTSEHIKNRFEQANAMEGVNGARLRELRDRRSTIEKGGGARKLEAIRATGRGTARERIGMLLDEGSFIELDAFVTHLTTHHSMHLHPSAAV